MPSREASLSKRVEQLERRLADLERRRADPHVADVARQRVRLAITVADGEDYPASPANVFPIVFLDATYTPTAGQQSLTTTPHAQTPQHVAYSFCGHLEEDTVVVVLEYQLRYYVIWTCTTPSAPGTVALARLGQDMCPDDACVEINCATGTCESPTLACNKGFVGLAGDVVVIAKIEPCCDDESGSGESGSGEDECDLLCDSGDSGASGCAAGACDPQWTIISVTPRPVCPVSDVKDRETCLVLIRSKMYGYYCDGDASAEKITDIGPCPSDSGSGESGSGEECDLSAEWGLACGDDSGSGDSGESGA